MSQLFILLVLIATLASCTCADWDWMKRPFGKTPFGHYKIKPFHKPAKSVIGRKPSFVMAKECVKNQIFGGENANLLTPKALEVEEPELQFHGYVDASTFAPIADAPNENAIDGVVCRDYRFDLRQQWPACAHIINAIQDQSLCSSCYALATAAALSDRRCIAMAKQGLPTPSTTNAHLSAMDVMECAGAGSSDACAGGYSSRVWRWFTEEGVASAGCKPYSITAQNGLQQYKYPANCMKECSNREHPNDYAVDKTKSTNFNVLGTLEAPGLAWNFYAKPSGHGWEQTMKEELLYNGSITADFVLYEDFFNYPNSLGIYKHTNGVEQYAHVVRLVGYGRVECNDGRTPEKYWLAANSWGAAWGANGFFRIARGTNECGLESRQIAFGTAKI